MVALRSSKLCLMVKEVSGVCLDLILALGWLTISVGVCSGWYGCARALHTAWVLHSSSVILVLGCIMIFAGVWSVSSQCWVLFLEVEELFWPEAVVAKSLVPSQISGAFLLL